MTDPRDDRATEAHWLRRFLVIVSLTAAALYVASSGVQAAIL